MADQTVSVQEMEDGRAAVAYRMAQRLWLESKDNHPGIDDVDEFLSLVDKCAGALSGRGYYVK